VDFDQLLAEMLGLVGEEVSVTVAGAEAGPPLVLDVTGRLERGTELGKAGGANDSVVFAIGGKANLVFDRATLREAGREGPVLWLDLGDVSVWVGPASA
jgi:hypothetical protein